MCEPVEKEIDPAVGPCVCGDSVWTAVGHCPDKANGDYANYYRCPRRKGLFKISEILPDGAYIKRLGL
ncbi:hypothetical protein SEA_PATELGO_211 [Streptomyces phage Patelgo]|nr:hypothetical protein SEA_PATELGO_211 [Streptomyces phage Patelgo]